mmetsp:Transcript_65927/g.182226  ORF Transcript_65927/g.182226 Transcript_65927/m.182226 type:complete len:207 (+) Transcript_65927:1046-1666(+)
MDRCVPARARGLRDPRRDPQRSEGQPQHTSSGRRRDARLRPRRAQRDSRHGRALYLGAVHPPRQAHQHKARPQVRLTHRRSSFGEERGWPGRGYQPARRQGALLCVRDGQRQPDCPARALDPAHRRHNRAPEPGLRGAGRRECAAPVQSVGLLRRGRARDRPRRAAGRGRVQDPTRRRARSGLSRPQPGLPSGGADAAGDPLELRP